MRDFLRLKFSFGLASRAKSENMAVPAAVLAFLASLAVPAVVLAFLTDLAVSVAVRQLGAPAQLKSTNGMFFAIWGLNPQYMCV